MEALEVACNAAPTGQHQLLIGSVTAQKIVGLYKGRDRKLASLEASLFCDLVRTADLADWKCADAICASLVDHSNNRLA